MTTQTAERQELYKMIDALPNDSVIAMRDLIRSLLPNIETDGWVDPIETGKLNAETLEALKEVKSGELISFGSKEKLFEFLDS